MFWLYSRLILTSLWYFEGATETHSRTICSVNLAEVDDLDRSLDDPLKVPDRKLPEVLLCKDVLDTSGVR